MARARSTTRRGEVPVGDDAYRVLDAAGKELAVRGMKALALIAAQERALRNYTEPTQLIVERRSLFGQPVTLYRVVREEDGAVSTYTVNRED